NPTTPGASRFEPDYSNVRWEKWFRPSRPAGCSEIKSINGRNFHKPTSVKPVEESDRGGTRARQSPLCVNSLRSKTSCLRRSPAVPAISRADVCIGASEKFAYAPVVAAGERHERSRDRPLQDQRDTGRYT